MPELQSNSLYTQIGVRDFATSTEIAEKLSRLQDIDSGELQTAVEILADYSLKNAYDMVLEAWTNPDRLLPRFATPEAAKVVIDVAKRTGFELNEVHTNTFQVRMPLTTESSEEREPVAANQGFDIKIGNRTLILETAKFIAHRERRSQRIRLEVISGESHSLLDIPDTIVQEETIQGDEGVLLRLKQSETKIETVNFAILNQSQSLTAPLAEGGRYLFSKSRQSIAASFQVRDSNDRIKQLIRCYYRDLADLVSQLDSRIGRQATLKSFINYFERYHS